MYNESFLGRNLTLVYFTSQLLDFLLPFFHPICLAQTVLYSSERENLFLLTFKLLFQIPSKFTPKCVYSACLLTFLNTKVIWGSRGWRLWCFWGRVSELCLTKCINVHLNSEVLLPACLFPPCCLISSHIFCSRWSLFLSGHQIHRG